MVGLPFDIVLLITGVVKAKHFLDPDVLLKLDYVVKNRAEVGKVVDVAAKLLDNCIAQTQGQTFQSAFFRAPLEIEIELVLPILIRQIGVRAKHRQRIGAQPVDPGKVITSAEKKCTLT